MSVVVHTAAPAASPVRRWSPLPLFCLRRERTAGGVGALREMRRQIVVTATNGGG
jgi:hypothetical protein